MKKKLFLLVMLVYSTIICNSQTLTDQTLIWNTSSFGAGFGHKLYAIDPQEGGRTDLRIAARQNSSQYSDLFTITSKGLVGINTMTPKAALDILMPNLDTSEYKSILCGINPTPMGTAANSFSPNLFYFSTKLDAQLGFHAYVYRKAASTGWAGGTVRLSSSADGLIYGQTNRFNNLNWIDFIGNGEGIDLGVSTNNPAISVRGSLVGIGTTTIPQAKLEVDAEGNPANLEGDITNGIMVKGTDQVLYMGANSTSHVSYIQSVDYGTAVAPLLLNARGGNVGINTTTPQYPLDVYGTIRAKEVLVNLNGTADFVFKDNYNLKPIQEVYNYAKENKHLPDVPSEAEVVKNGMNMGEFQVKLLQKVEELTLYMAQQDKTIQAQQAQLQTQQDKIHELEEKINK